MRRSEDPTVVRQRAERVLWAARFFEKIRDARDADEGMRLTAFEVALLAFDLPAAVK